MDKKRSPIQGVPLRNPGDFLYRKRFDLVLNKIVPWLILLCILAIHALMDWAELLLQTQPKPISSTVIFFIALFLFLINHWKVSRELRNYDLGMMGERYVAEELSNLHANGYHIINDIPVGKMNIDHVVVGPSGVFTIETKMMRKPSNGKAIISHAGDDLLINGKKSKSNSAMWQATTQKKYLHEVLKKHSNQEVHIQSVVIYAGWFVEDNCQNDVWVMNEKYFVQKLKNLPEVLSSNEVNSLRKIIESYARAASEKQDYVD